MNISISTRQAYSEIDEFLDLLSPEKRNKIPQKLQQLFKDGLKDQWLTSDVLITTLQEYSNEETEIGKKAYDAATKVRTFSQLMATLKEAAQSGWGMTWELLVGDFNEATDFLTEISDKIGGILDASSKARKDYFKLKYENKPEEEITSQNGSRDYINDLNKKEPFWKLNNRGWGIFLFLLFVLIILLVLFITAGRLSNI